jgi:ELWxxDGT repeat protein
LSDHASRGAQPSADRADLHSPTLGRTVTKGISGREVAVIGTAPHRIRCNLGAALAFLLIVPLIGTSPATGAGAKLVRDIKPGVDDSKPIHLTGVGGRLLFLARTRAHGRELWRSDGTRRGTKLVRDIAVGRYGATTRFPLDHMENIGGTLFFAADDDIHGVELWRSDGTRRGTTLVRDINPGGRGSYGSPGSLTRFGGALYFFANDGDAVHAYELWRSDGTRRGTKLVRDINPDGSSSPWSFTRAGGLLFFNAFHPNYGWELWRSDGTEAGTILVREIIPGKEEGGDLSGVGEKVDLAGTLMFAAHAGTGYGLWRSDGSEAGTTLVGDSYPFGWGPWELTNLGGTLFFSADDGIHGVELLRSDGTEPGALVADVRPGERGSGPAPIAAAGGNLYFAANDGIHGRELWRSDGTDAGTELVSDVQPGEEGSEPSRLIGAGGELFFTATDDIHGRELWRSDGTEAGTKLVRDIARGRVASEPKELSNVGGTLFFTAVNSARGRELWKAAP